MRGETPEVVARGRRRRSKDLWERGAVSRRPGKGQLREMPGCPELLRTLRRIP